MKIYLLIYPLSFLLISFYGLCQQVHIDLRHRPPEIIIHKEQFSGPIIDIIDELMRSVDYSPQWANIPWPRTLIRAENGLSDIVPRHSMTPNREEFLLPMLLGFENRNVFFLLSPEIKNIDQYQSVNDLDSLRFGLLNGSYYGPYIATKNTDTRTIFLNKVDQLLSMLLSGRIDVMPIQNMDWAEASYREINNKFEKKHYQVAPIKESFVNGIYISIPKLSSISKKYHKLNCTLFQWRKSGKINNIYQKNKIEPYLQLFKNSASIKQSRSCLK